MKGGLAERWADKPVGEISGHDCHRVITEAIEDGIPGMKAWLGLTTGPSTPKDNSRQGLAPAG